MDTYNDKAMVNIDFCKGQDKGAILLGWEIAETSNEVIAEIARELGVENDRNIVAETLSKM